MSLVDQGGLRLVMLGQKGYCLPPGRFTHPDCLTHSKQQASQLGHPVMQMHVSQPAILHLTRETIPSFVQVPIVPVIPKAPPQVRPANLSSQQQLSLRRGAIHRILANGNTPSQETRIALLSRLATKSPAGDGIGDEILQHMFRDYHTNHGHELALTWLFALYKEHSAQTDTARSVVSGLSNTEGGAAARLAVKAESAAEAASGRTDPDMDVGVSDALVKRSEGGTEAGPSGMEIDGLEGKHMSSD